MRRALFWSAAIALTLALLYGTLAAVVIAKLSPKDLWHEVTLEFVNPHPGFTYFVVYRAENGAGIANDRLTLTDGPIGRASIDNLYWSRFYPLRLCGVPNELSGKFSTRSVAGPSENSDWLDNPDVSSKLRWSGELGPQYTSTSFTDPRESISRRYRVEQTPTELKVDLIEETTVKSWTDIVLVGSAGVLIFLTVVWCIVWLIRKACRRPPLPAVER